MGDIADSDFDGLEQVTTEMVEMSATGISTLYGPVSASLRPLTSHPFQRTVGEIEENANTQANRLDLPPFAPAGTASSLFNVYFEIHVAGQTYHNDQPKLMLGRITYKPPAPGDQYQGTVPLQLYDEQHQPSPFYVGQVIHIPNDVKPTGVPVTGRVPSSVAIQEIRPNPTTGAATIFVALPERARTRIVAYDVNGRVVRTLFDGMMDAGVRPVPWDGRNDRGEGVAGGVYFIRLESLNQSSVRRMAVVK
jgi:hypothetical protein